MRKVLSDQGLSNRKTSLSDKFLNACVYIISFFIFNGFYAFLALGITIFGSAASRLVSVPIRLMTTALMIIVIAFSFYKKRKNSRDQVVTNFIFLLFWSLYFMKVLWHYNSGMALRLSWVEYIFYAVNFVVLPFYMYGQISFAKYKSTIINALILSGFLMGLTTLYLYKEILISGIARIDLYAYQNPALETLSPLSLSYASILTIMLCVYKLLYENKKSRGTLIYLVVTIGLSLVMFLLGASRGSVLAFVVSLIYLILHSDFKSKLKIGMLIISMIPVLIWSVAASGSAVFERTTNSVDSGSTGREELWSDAWQEFLNHPFTGGRIEIGFYPHNIILEILMATGVLGLAIVSILFIKGFIKISYLPKININYLWVAIIFLQGFCQLLFSAALYQATLVFFPLGIILSKYIDEKKILRKQSTNKTKIN